MKYILRAAAYFLKMTVILVIIIFALAKLKFVNADLGTMFVNGYDSLWQIALILAAFSAVYPKLGYSRREARALGDPSLSEPALRDVMESHGYKLSEETPEGVRVYVYRSVFKRALAVWEDGISVKRTLAGYEFEGSTKIVVRLVSALEYKLRENGEDA